MQTIRIKPIGVIRTPFTSLEDMPIQPGGGRDVQGELVIEPQYCEGFSCTNSGCGSRVHQSISRRNFAMKLNDLAPG